jgi:hypothetical protein
MSEAVIAEIQRAHRLKLEAMGAIESAFRNEAQLRKERSVEEWRRAELEAVWGAGLDFARARGFPIVPIDEVAAVERMAAGHCDYGSKWALYVAEKIVPRVGAQRP